MRALAVLLPALGLAGLWGLSEQTYRQGTEWEVPIMGYDPRDILRGHYVEFSYDWPGLEPGSDEPPTMLCLIGERPRLARVEVIESETDMSACAHPVRAETADVYGLQGLLRGRLYVGQDRARQIDKRLRDRDQRGVVTIRQRDDGSFTPIAIGFRPLTPAERAERAEP